MADVDLQSRLPDRADLSVHDLVDAGSSRLRNTAAMARRSMGVSVRAHCFWLAGRYLDAQLIEHFAIVSLAVSGAAFVFGKDLARKWRFPLLFLFFMVPFGEILSPTLRTMTAFASSSLLNLAGLNASLNELIITTSGGRFHIADACSGLRFLLAATIVASIFSYYTFSNWRKAAMFFAVAVVIALVSNILRVTIVIAMATMSSDMSSVVEDHMLLGWVFYAASLTILIMLGLKLSDDEFRTK